MSDKVLIERELLDNLLAFLLTRRLGAEVHIDALRAALAADALDRLAQTNRELGLDYAEPVACCAKTSQGQLHDFAPIGGRKEVEWFCARMNQTFVPLYTTPPAAPAVTEPGILSRAIDCLALLAARPRPLCRECGDNNGRCPTTGLDCDLPKLIADARAALAAAPEVPR